MRDCEVTVYVSECVIAGMEVNAILLQIKKSKGNDPQWRYELWVTVNQLISILNCIHFSMFIKHKFLGSSFSINLNHTTLRKYISMEWLLNSNYKYFTSDSRVFSIQV